jgi:hypothetical protein
MSTTITVQPDDKHPAVSAWQRDLVSRYGEHLNNTGGNDPLDLLNDLATKKNLASTNIIVFTLAVSVSSQVSLLRALDEAGLLTPQSAEVSA